MGMPVVIAPDGLGAPFTISPQGMPAIIATNGYGLPINIVPQGGTPIAFVYGWPTTTFTDDFAGDGALSGDWTKVFGSGTISRVAGKPVLAGATATYSAPTTGSPNHFAAGDYEAADAFLYCKLTNSSNCVGFRWTAAGFLSVSRAVSGTTVNFLSQPWPEPAIGTRMELRIYNDKATAFLAGEAVPGLVGIDVSSVAASNLAGMRGITVGSAVFDNFACGTLS